MSSLDDNHLRGQIFKPGMIDMRYISAMKRLDSLKGNIQNNNT